MVVLSQPDGEDIMKRFNLFVCVSFASMVACGSRTGLESEIERSTPAVEPTNTVSSDSGPESGPDTAVDVVEIDVAHEAAKEATSDVTADVTVPDTAFEAGSDAGRDATADIGSEAAPDAVGETSVETGSDVGVDVVSDVPDATSSVSWKFCEPWSDPVTSKANGWYRGCCVTGGSFTASTSPKPMQLVKGTGSLVYYLASDGKRHAFPFTTVLSSWLGPYDTNNVPQDDPTVCASVVEVPDVTLAAFEIGASVTMRPGTYVTAIVSGPWHWAISKGGVLRQIPDDGIGTAIFGSSYAGRLRLTPDAFLPHYVVGTNLVSASDYDPGVEFKTTLEQDLGLAP